MTNRNLPPIDEVGRRVRHLLTQVRRDLVTEKIEIDPPRIFAADAATQRPGKKVARRLQVRYRKGKVK